MSQVIMLFLFPIGLYFYFFVERPSRPKYQKIFDDFEVKVQKNTTLTKEEKLTHYEEMLLRNDYKIVEKTDSMVEGEKRIFSMSLFAMSVGFFYVGAFLYLFYYFYIEKPHRIYFKI